jgi:hypothetical protein
LLVTRYSGGDDIFILTPSHTGNTLNGINGVGMDGLNDPTDIIEDPATGNLYVSQLGTDRSGAPRNLITLLKPATPPAAAANLASSSTGLPVYGAVPAAKKFPADDVTSAISGLL